MPVSSRGPRRRRSWWCHTPLIDSGYPHACKGGRGSDAAVQARLDRGSHGTRSCQLSSQSGNGGSLDAQLSDRPADRPHTQTHPGCAHLLAVFQECHRLAGGFAAYPAPHCVTGSLPEPRPWARRSPHHHTPVTLSKSPHNLGSQHSGHRTLCQALERTRAERQQPDGNPPHQRADHTNHNPLNRRTPHSNSAHNPTRRTQNDYTTPQDSTLPATPDQHPLTHTQLERT